MSNEFLQDGRMTPIGTETVVEKVIKQLTQAISAGRFKLGEKLPSEFELMEELHVSRNSLREAMKMLATMGVVDIRRGDGTYICAQIKPSMFDSIIYNMMLESSSDQEVIELRQTLDEAVLKMAIQKCSEQDIAKLQSYIVQMRNNFADGKLSQAARMDYEFHIYLTECCQNSFLAHIVNGVYQLFERSIENNIRTEELFAKADQHHQDIVDCLKARDLSRVGNVIDQSLSSWKQNVKKCK